MVENVGDGQKYVRYLHDFHATRSCSVCHDDGAGFVEQVFGLRWLQRAMTYWPQARVSFYVEPTVEVLWLYCRGAKRKEKKKVCDRKEFQILLSSLSAE